MFYLEIEKLYQAQREWDTKNLSRVQCHIAQQLLDAISKSTAPILYGPIHECNLNYAKALAHHGSRPWFDKYGHYCMAMNQDISWDLVPYQDDTGSGLSFVLSKDFNQLYHGQSMLVFATPSAPIYIHYQKIGRLLPSNFIDEEL